MRLDERSKLFILLRLVLLHPHSKLIFLVALDLRLHRYEREWSCFFETDGLELFVVPRLMQRPRISRKICHSWDERRVRIWLRENGVSERALEDFDLSGEFIAKAKADKLRDRVHACCKKADVPSVLSKLEELQRLVDSEIASPTASADLDSAFQQVCCVSQAVAVQPITMLV